jgi:hypothetical protein
MGTPSGVRRCQRRVGSRRCGSRIGPVRDVLDSRDAQIDEQRGLLARFMAIAAQEALVEAAAKQAPAGCELRRLMTAARRDPPMSEILISECIVVMRGNPTSARC